MQGKEHKSFISPSATIPEFTPVPLIVGVVLGIVFGASSLYLALKVGMTVSASIPVAVLSITLFKGFSKVFGLRSATILENNIVQTVGSAGESIAFGVAVTMPALLILGYEMELGRIMLVAVLGGLLGILMMIPLRYSLIVKEHGTLAYPEGTACAEVLIVGEKGGTSAKTVFTGFFVGLFYKFFNTGAKLWNDAFEKPISWFKGAAVSAEVSPELLGVGYIIGPRIASITVAGGILSSWVFIPMIKLFGDGLPSPLFPATKPISQMGGHEIWGKYVLYIGAGAVAAGGFISLARSLPTIIRGAMGGLSGLKAAGSSVKSTLRTERDIPMFFVIAGVVSLVLAIWAVPTLQMNLLGALLIVAFGFLFVTVSSRLTGEIGSSSNPISGMTVATLLVTSLIFLALGWVGPEHRVTALTIAAIVCVAASNGGTISQDLKTGYLVGATPYFQQLGILLGAFSSALVIGYTLIALNDATTIYSKKAVPSPIKVENFSSLTERSKVHDPAYSSDSAEYRVFRLAEPQQSGPYAGLQAGKYLVDETGTIQYFVDPGVNGVLKVRDNGLEVKKYEAPKARLMSLIIDGILTQKLPWGLVLLGVAVAFMVELCGVPALPFAVGVYLPLAVSAPIFCGGVVRWLVDAISARKGVVETAEEAESGPGILFSSGLIAGGSITGIVLAFIAYKEWDFNLGAYVPGFSQGEWTPLIMFGIMMVVLFRVAMSKAKKLAR